MKLFNKLFNKRPSFTKEHILSRLSRMENLATIYASQAAQANVEPLKSTYKSMSIMYLNRYSWYLEKMMNGDFDHNKRLPD